MSHGVNDMVRLGSRGTWAMFLVLKPELLSRGPRAKRDEGASGVSERIDKIVEQDVTCAT